MPGKSRTRGHEGSDEEGWHEAEGDEGRGAGRGHMHPGTEIGSAFEILFCSVVFVPFASDGFRLSVRWCFDSEENLTEL